DVGIALALEPLVGCAAEHRVGLGGADIGPDPGLAFRRYVGQQEIVLVKARDLRVPEDERLETAEGKVGVVADLGHRRLDFREGGEAVRLEADDSAAARSRLEVGDDVGAVAALEDEGGAAAAARQNVVSRSARYDVHAAASGDRVGQRVAGRVFHAVG